MQIKTISDLNAQAKTPEKNEKKIGKPFKEVLRHKEKEKHPEKKKSIFDFETDRMDVKIDVKESALLSLSEKSSEAIEVAKLSLETIDLIEAMANYIKIESNNGISTTTVEIKMEDSVFNGTELMIHHYDTHPHAFNIQLMGNPEAVEILASQLASLQLALQSHEPLSHFEIHLLTPILKEKEPLYLRGKEKTKSERNAPINSTLKKMTS